MSQDPRYVQTFKMASYTLSTPDMFLYKPAQFILVIVSIIWSLSVRSSFIPHSTLPVFIHSHRYIYTWEATPDPQGAMLQFEGTERPFILGAQLAAQTLEVMELKWHNTDRQSSSEICVRRTGTEIPVIEEIDQKASVTFSYIGKKGPYNCFNVHFQRTMGETAFSINNGYFEPSLTKKSVNPARADAGGAFSVDLYSRQALSSHDQSNQNTSSTGFGVGGSGSPLTVSSGSSSSGGSGGAPPKPRPQFFYMPDIDVVIRPSLFEFPDSPEPDFSAMELSTSISIDIFVDGQPYQLILTKDEWRMLVERNLHRSPFLLFRLARHQGAARLNRFLLLKELDDALSNGEEGRTQRLLNEYNDIPPERIYIHSWLAATCLHFLLQETGVQIIPAAQNLENPEEYLKKLEQLVQKLVQSKKLQQALANSDNTYDQDDESAWEQEPPDSLNTLETWIAQQVSSQWRKLLSRTLASVEWASINPTPTILQAATDGTDSAVKTTGTESAAQSDSTSANSLRATPLPGGQEKSGDGEDEKDEKDEKDDEDDRKAASPPESITWEELFQKVKDSIVRIEYLQVIDYKFPAGSFLGTGFVVDAEKGIILTNRHMGTEAPVIAQARFNNQETVAIRPLYSDPVNDFGFYQYSPEELTQNRPESLMLAPQAAQPGVEVMMAGSDRGERAAIIKGQLSDLEREAPGYDLNTFYFLMATGIHNGSSGSPAINTRGEVVAMNSGGVTQDGANSAALLLPVDQAMKALQALREKNNILRGSILTEFKYKSRDRLREMNTSPQSISEIEGALCSGLLAVHSVIQEGPGDGVLENGDILLKVNGQWACNFNVLVEAMNANIGNHLSLRIERHQIIREVSVLVQDAHRLLPSKIFEIAGGHFCDLRYNTANKNYIPFRGVSICSLGSYFDRGVLEVGDIIYKVNGVENTDTGCFYS